MTVAIPCTFRKKRAWLVIEKDTTPRERADEFHKDDFHMGLIPVNEPFDEKPTTSDILFILGAMTWNEATHRGLLVSDQQAKNKTSPEDRWEHINEELSD